MRVVGGTSDFDGDGRRDLLIHGVSDDPEYQQDELWILTDPTQTPDIDLSADQFIGTRVVSSAWGVQAFPRHAVGDLDDDGADELIVMQRTAWTGDTAFQIVLVRGGPQGEQLDLSQSSNRLVIYRRPDPNAGRAEIGAVGDLDGDGAPELTVLDSSAGGIVIISGVVLQDRLASATGDETPELQELLDADLATVIESPLPSGVLGLDHVLLGDVDDDGASELVITDAHGLRGRVFVLLGGEPWSGSASLEQLEDMGRVLVLEGVAAGDRADQAAAGDFDGDGRPDLIVGARGVTAAPCELGLVYGLPATDMASGWSLAAVEQGGMGVLWTGSESPALSAGFVAGLSDVTGDGVDDLAVWSSDGAAWLLPGTTAL
jgi:hypothetical protein